MIERLDRASGVVIRPFLAAGVMVCCLFVLCHRASAVMDGFLPDRLSTNVYGVMKLQDGSVLVGEFVTPDVTIGTAIGDITVSMRHIHSITMSPAPDGMTIASHNADKLVGTTLSSAVCFRTAELGPVNLAWTNITEINVSRVIFVCRKANGNQDGYSWNNAFNELREAINVAQAGDEIWVAEGVYTPTSGQDRSVAFKMPAHVALYGGFQGSETARSERNWRQRKSVLSGNIGAGTSDDNSTHVVLGANDSLLDGFVVTAGKGTRRFGGGSGMLNNHVSPTVRNCVFQGNSVEGSGTVRNLSCTPVFENCFFVHNSGRYATGLLFENCSYPEASPAMINCVVARNSSTSPDILINGGRVTLLNCTIAMNAYAGIGVQRSADVTLKNCIIWGNRKRQMSTHTARQVVFENSVLMKGFDGIWNISGKRTILDKGGNLFGDPMFLNSGDPDGADNMYGTHDDGFNLKIDSPCKHAGARTPLSAIRQAP